MAKEKKNKSAFEGQPVNNFFRQKFSFNKAFNRPQKVRYTQHKG